MYTPHSQVISYILQYISFPDYLFFPFSESIPINAKFPGTAEDQLKRAIQLQKKRDKGKVCLKKTTFRNKKLILFLFFLNMEFILSFNYSSKMNYLNFVIFLLNKQKSKNVKFLQYFHYFHCSHRSDRTIKIVISLQKQCQ